MRQNYKSNKRQKETARQKKQEEKRNKKQSKTAENTVVSPEIVSETTPMDVPENKLKVF